MVVARGLRLPVFQIEPIRATGRRPALVSDPQLHCGTRTRDSDEFNLNTASGETRPVEQLAQRLVANGFARRVPQDDICLSLIYLHATDQTGHLSRIIAGPR